MRVELTAAQRPTYIGFVISCCNDCLACRGRHSWPMGWIGGRLVQGVDLVVGLR